MIYANKQVEPGWLELPYDVRMKLGPFDPGADVAAQRVAGIYLRDNLPDRSQLGHVDLDQVEAINDAAQCEGTIALARRRVVAWEGVAGNGKEPAPCTPDLVERVLRQVPTMLSAFRVAYADQALEWALEGNVSGALPPGIGGEAPDTAPTAEPSANPAPQPSDGAATTPA